MMLKKPIRYALFSTIILLCLGMFRAQAQFTATTTSFDGYWVGTLANILDDNEEKGILIHINNGTATRLYFDEESNDFKTDEFDKESSSFLGNSFHYIWFNHSGEWSESHSHSFAFLNPNRLWCVLTQQMTIAVEDEEIPGINEEYNDVYIGGLDRYDTKEALRASFTD